jgi:ATP-dependent RNA helicase DOB1
MFIRYVDNLKPQMMDVVMSWLEGYKFVDIMEMSSMYEGSIVRVIRRLEEVVRELAGAAKTIGNVELSKKLEDSRARLKRGIMFAASLYI